MGPRPWIAALLNNVTMSGIAQRQTQYAEASAPTGNPFPQRIVRPRKHGDFLDPRSRRNCSAASRLGGHRESRYHRALLGWDSSHEIFACRARYCVRSPQLPLASQVPPGSP